VTAGVDDHRPSATVAGGMGWDGRPGSRDRLPMRYPDEIGAPARVLGPSRGFMHISCELCMNRRVR